MTDKPRSKKAHLDGSLLVFLCIPPPMVTIMKGRGTGRLWSSKYPTTTPPWQRTRPRTMQLHALFLSLHIASQLPHPKDNHNPAFESTQSGPIGKHPTVESPTSRPMGDKPGVSEIKEACMTSADRLQQKVREPRLIAVSKTGGCRKTQPAMLFAWRALVDCKDRRMQQDTAGWDG